MKMFTAVGLVLLLFALPFAVRGETPNDPESKIHEANAYGSIHLLATGFHSDDGVALIDIHNTKETYLEPGVRYRGAKVPIKKGKVRYVFDGVPLGKYVVIVVHDENENQELDRNFLGIPFEDFGFSNGARSNFGPPSYHAAEFVLGVPKLDLKIEVGPAI